MKRFAIVALVLLLGACVSNPPQQGDLGYRGKGDRVFGFSSVEEAKQVLKAREDAEVKKQRGWTLISIREERTHYAFTPRSHPAYPSVVRRQVIERDGKVLLQMRVVCGAHKSICDKLVREFQEMNDAVRQGLQKHAK